MSKTKDEILSEWIDGDIAQIASDIDELGIDAAVGLQMRLISIARREDHWSALNSINECDVRDRLNQIAQCPRTRIDALVGRMLDSGISGEIVALALIDLAGESAARMGMSLEQSLQTMRVAWTFKRNEEDPE